MIYISKNLKFLREKLRMKQGELAKMLDIKPNTISNYENGVSTPDYVLLEKIVNIYKVSAHDILYSDIEFQSQEEKSRKSIDRDSFGELLNKICDLSAENALLRKENEELKEINIKKRGSNDDVPHTLAAEPQLKYKTDD